MSAVPSSPCLCQHCEREAAGANDLGLCDGCHHVRGIRRLYEARDDWPPWWEEHLRRLAERARRRLPLFPK
jgi:hypothetical protein